MSKGQVGAKKTNASRILDTLKIEYATREYQVDDADFCVEAVADLLGLPYGQVLKTLVARGDKTGVMMACLPAGTELDLKALAKASGNKTVELVPVKDLQALTGYIRGGCSPLGAKKKYPLYVHTTAQAEERLAVNAGTKGLLLILTPHDLQLATDACFAPIAR